MRVELGGSRYTIDWSHARFEPRPLLLPSGKEKLVHGATTCIISPEDGSDIGGGIGILGVAWCSTDDPFLKARGRKESLREALEKWGISREERAEVWRRYHERQ